MTFDQDDRRVGGGLLLHLLPALAFAATFGVFFIDKSREARTSWVAGAGSSLRPAS